jgi:hypothetical protein
MWPYYNWWRRKLLNISVWRASRNKTEFVLARVSVLLLIRPLLLL